MEQQVRLEGHVEEYTNAKVQAHRDPVLVLASMVPPNIHLKLIKLTIILYDPNQTIQTLSPSTQQRHQPRSQQHAKEDVSQFRRLRFHHPWVEQDLMGEELDETGV